jgi:hypothetical protein
MIPVVGRRGELKDKRLQARYEQLHKWAANVGFAILKSIAPNAGIRVKRWTFPDGSTVECIENTNGLAPIRRANVWVPPLPDWDERRTILLNRVLFLVAQTTRAAIVLPTERSDDMTPWADLIVDTPNGDTASFIAKNNARVLAYRGFPVLEAPPADHDLQPLIENMSYDARPPSFCREEVGFVQVAAGRIYLGGVPIASLPEAALELPWAQEGAAAIYKGVLYYAAVPLDAYKARDLELWDHTVLPIQVYQKNARGGEWVLLREWADFYTEEIAASAEYSYYWGRPRVEWHPTEPKFCFVLNGGKEVSLGVWGGVPRKGEAVYGVGLELEIVPGEVDADPPATVVVHQYGSGVADPILPSYTDIKHIGRETLSINPVNSLIYHYEVNAIEVDETLPPVATTAGYRSETLADGTESVSFFLLGVRGRYSYLREATEYQETWSQYVAGPDTVAHDGRRYMDTKVLRSEARVYELVSVVGPELAAPIPVYGVVASDGGKAFAFPINLPAVGASCGGTPNPNSVSGYRNFSMIFIADYQGDPYGRTIGAATTDWWYKTGPDPNMPIGTLHYRIDDTPNVEESEYTVQTVSNGPTTCSGEFGLVYGEATPETSTSTGIQQTYPPNTTNSSAFITTVGPTANEPTERTAYFVFEIGEALYYARTSFGEGPSQYISQAIVDDANFVHRHMAQHPQSKVWFGQAMTHTPFWRYSPGSVNCPFITDEEGAHLLTTYEHVAEDFDDAFYSKRFRVTFL